MVRITEEENKKERKVVGLKSITFLKNPAVHGGTNPPAGHAVRWCSWGGGCGVSLW